VTVFGLGNRGLCRTRLRARSARPSGSSSAFGLWAEAKRLAGDSAAADRLDRTAREATATLENYSEVAALYFHLAWRDNQPVTLSKFSNPTVVTFH
jgi:hypothetical protein